MEKKFSTSVEDGVVYILGKKDSGKTSTVLALTKKAAEKNKSVTLIDLDPGQSTFGPPCCYGLGLSIKLNEKPWNVHEERFLFIGDVTPKGAYLQSIYSQVCLLKQASDIANNLTIVDSPGWIDGEEALRLKKVEINLCMPHWLIVLEEEGECQAIYKDFESRTDITITILKPKHTKTRRLEERVSYHRRKLEEYFKNSSIYTFDIKKLTFLNYVPIFQDNKRLEELDFLEDVMQQANLTRLDYSYMKSLLENKIFNKRYYDIHEINKRSTSIPRLNNIVVGLCDTLDNCLGLGVIVFLDKRKYKVRIKSPLANPEKVQIILLGRCLAEFGKIKFLNI